MSQQRASRELLERCLLAVALVCLTLGLYWKTGSYDFLNIDDDVYVTRNPLLQEVLRDGLTPSALWAACGSLYAENWHPVTWMSHMLDVRVFGMDAGAHHLVNAALHALTSALCFLALASLAGAHSDSHPGGRDTARVEPRVLGLPRATLASLFVAALFALHPLHVESVAWVAERKDLLAGLFWFACLWAYAAYVRRPGLGRYLLVALLFVLSLAAKPMAITLPCVLLLLDRWPLRREVSWKKLLLEKLPLFAAVAASALVTMVAQSNAFLELEHVALSQRLANAVYAFAVYLGQLAWPVDLAFFYPHPALLNPEASSAWGAANFAAGALLIFTCFGAWALRRRAPHVTVGILWFLGTLVPVIGLLQVGAQSHADRYTYIPSVGIFIALAWSGIALCTSPARQRVIGVLGAACLIALALRTSDQIETWASSRTLTEHALEVSADNYLARCNLGNALEAEGALDAAREQYKQADALRPDHPGILYNRARVEISARRWRVAERRYRRLLETWPDYLPALSDLGVLLSDLGRDRDALVPLTRVWETPPPAAERVNAGYALVKILATSPQARLRDGDRAVRIARECLSLDAGWRNHQALALALAESGDFAGAVSAQRRALERVPAEGVESLTLRLQLFESGQPYHRPEAP